MFKMTGHLLSFCVHTGFICFHRVEYVMYLNIIIILEIEMLLDLMVFTCLYFAGWADHTCWWSS